MDINVLGIKTIDGEVYLFTMDDSVVIKMTPDQAIHISALLLKHADEIQKREIQ